MFMLPVRFSEFLVQKFSNALCFSEKIVLYSQVILIVEFCGLREYVSK